MNELEKLFIETLISQTRALDQFGTWAKKSDEELLCEKYVKSKEELKNVPIIADIDEMQIQDIRLIFQAIALAFELKTGVMCSVVMEMSHEGFGRAVVLADKIVVTNKFFKDAHRYSFRTYEDVVKEGGKMLKSAIEIYEQYTLKVG
ncbi:MULTISPECIES: NifX-associated nitrogen fixation protein [unclassified Sulfurospirillum]|uniref:NifX-associated nitrogen fixation protein n=1 Tax=unclassified Sulfurospirillum TaxID=2618290 RepID=UPI000541CC20|nr:MULTISPECIES: NifX-associated nitrogen fixation protein [unclassified Sulfurospirillum]KHG33500.1 MAG: nitrogen fixation protein [Sulfurospirillum sp. MES]MCP3651442.1 NifX-associated nitrogen fixation protein [Sulfurospirillum sp. DNRA8]MCR1810289.1 NifX-associated nitrogen fixation protein [Sulfurospirillum sp. DNRA8]